MIPRLLILSLNLLLGDPLLFLCLILLLILCWVLVSINLFPAAASNFKTATVSAATAAAGEPDAEACHLGVAIVFGTAQSAGFA
jgi:hypothetical protein